MLKREKALCASPFLALESVLGLFPDRKPKSATRVEISETHVPPFLRAGPEVQAQSALANLEYQTMCVLVKPRTLEGARTPQTPLHSHCAANTCPSSEEQGVPDFAASLISLGRRVP